MTKLYVGNLPYSYTDQSLMDMFASYGNVVSTAIISDKMSGRSKGFAFIDMDPAEADKAMQALNGAEMDGRKIIVNEARPMEDRPPRRDFRGRR